MNKEKRKVEVFKNSKRTKFASCFDMEVGDKIRIFESDGVPVVNVK